MRFLKGFIIWFVILVYCELIFSIFSYNTILGQTFINILLFSSFFAVILSFFSGLFKKTSFVRYIFLFILGFYFSAQYVFHDVFLSYFSFSMLGMSEQLTSFMNEAVDAIVSNLHVIILFFIPFILTVILRKKLSVGKFNLKDYIFNFLSLVLVVSILVINITLGKNELSSTYDLLFNINENALNIEKLGVVPSSAIDIYRMIFGFENDFVMETPEPEISEDVELGYNVLDLNFSDTTNKNIKSINNYIQSLSGTKKNEYTGLFKDYNLIFITAESFSEIAVDPVLTPTLYKLVNSGFVFTNFYTPNNASTLGGEFQSVTGLFANGSALPTWRKGTNTFPFGLSTVFEDAGYKTYAYHNHTYSFQNRNKYLKSIGFDNYKACGNGLEKLINCKTWPESDIQLMSATTNDYINDEQFFAYYMTVSGHFQYSFDGSNSISKKHKDKVKDLNYSTSVKAYLATQIELDLALENLISTLEEKGVLDKTVIVMQADHYPYKLSLSDMNSRSNYVRDNVVEVNHNSLIIWNPNIEYQVIDKVCMSIDVIPTIYNLFGIEYDSRLFVGQDIFSDSDGLVMFTNRSWVTEYGTYFASNSKFVPKVDNVPENYVETINNIVNNRINISKMIITNNYYKYVTVNENE